MLRALMLLACVSGPAFAQAPTLRFQWPKDQALDYRVNQTTKVSETVLDAKGKATASDVKTTLTLMKRWSIREVDAAGTATMDLSITQMKQVVERPNGSTSTIDSANPEDARQMAEFLNKPVLTLKVDARGQIVDVKETRPGAASRIQSELPFRLVLPESIMGQPWSRPFAITLDPPHGTGERYEATQTFTMKGTKDALAVIGLETSLKAPPATAAEKIPLAPMLWSGDVYFDTTAGRFHAARLAAKAEITNHQGDGSKFVYESVYAEDLVNGK